MHDVSNLRTTIIPKSDQLNAEQLLAGPMTVTVSEVRTSTSDEQPVVVHYEGENGRPFKPCKTMRKLLVFAWGEDGRKWVGRSMTLFNDPRVRFGGDEVGGIRISHMTDIDGAIKVSLTSTRGKKAQHEIKQLASDDAEHMKQLRSAKTEDELKAAFESAYRSTRTQSRRDAFKAEYDAMKSKLKAPATKTLADYTDSVKSATDEETAWLVVDAARDDLSAEDLEALAEVVRAKFAK